MQCCLEIDANDKYDNYFCDNSEDDPVDSIFNFYIFTDNFLCFVTDNLRGTYLSKWEFNFTYYIIFTVKQFPFLEQLQHIF